MKGLSSSPLTALPLLPVTPTMSDSLLEQYASKLAGARAGSAADLIELFQLYKLHGGIGSVDSVYEAGRQAVGRGGARSKLGDGYWDVLEGLIHATLHSSKSRGAEEAQPWFKELQSAFPKSSRVKRLQGLMLEAQGKRAEAISFYEDAIESTPAESASAWKRLVALQKAQAQASGLSASSITVAADTLRKCLEVFSADAEAWLELAELQLQLKQWRQAAFCYEELLLLAPNRPDYHSRLAEVGAGRWRRAGRREGREGGQSRGVFAFCSSSSHQKLLSLCLPLLAPLSASLFPAVPGRWRQCGGAAASQAACQ